MSTSFYLSRRALRPAAKSSMPRWQDRLFIGLARSASEWAFPRSVERPRYARTNVRLWPKADIAMTPTDVRFWE
jgi:hypothetical protein